MMVTRADAMPVSRVRFAGYSAGIGIGVLVLAALLGWYYADDVMFSAGDPQPRYGTLSWFRTFEIGYLFAGFFTYLVLLAVAYPLWRRSERDRWSFGGMHPAVIASMGGVLGMLAIGAACSLFIGQFSLLTLVPPIGFALCTIPAAALGIVLSKPRVAEIAHTVLIAGWVLLLISLGFGA